MPAPHAPRDFADLARRISSRTIDLFAVALIAVALLTIGVQATRWWRTEPPAITGGPAATTPLGIWDDAAHAAVQLETGDWSLERFPATGPADVVTARAVETARRDLLADRPTQPGPPNSDEERWLAALARSTPVEEPGNAGKIYVLGGPWPWVVATRPIRAQDPDPALKPDAVEQSRVVCWLFALPQADQAWTLYVARRGGNPGDKAVGFDVPIPQDVQRLLSTRNSVGGAAVFSGSDLPARARNQWERQLTDAGWTRRGDWSQTGRLVHGIFERQQSGRRVLLDALLTVDADNRLRGIAEWHIEPATSP